DSTADQGRGDNRIDAAAQGTDDAPIAHFRPNAVETLLDEVGGRPLSLAAADVVEEVFDELGAARSVMNLGVELEPVEPTLGVAHRGVGTIDASRQGSEAGRESLDAVSVAHPYFHRRVQPVKQGSSGLDRDQV